MVLTPAKRRLDDGAVGRRRRRRVRGAKDQGPARSNVPRSSAYAAAAVAAVVGAAGPAEGGPAGAAAPA